MALALLLLLLCIVRGASSDVIAEFDVVVVDVLVSSFDPMLPSMPLSGDWLLLSSLFMTVCGGDGGDVKYLLIGKYISMILLQQQTKDTKELFFAYQNDDEETCRYVLFVWIFGIDFIDHVLETAWHIGEIATICQMFIGEWFNGCQCETCCFVDLCLSWQI